MVYRLHEHRMKEPVRSLVDVNTPARIYVNQGVLSHLAFPCWYQEIHKPIPAHPHNRFYHDYLGWPYPGHPDRICQLWAPDQHCCILGKHHECSPHCEHYIDMSRLIPIHLTDEGYTDVEMYIDRVLINDEDNIAYIDDRSDWIIRADITMDTDIESIAPIEHDIAIYVIAYDSETETVIRRDLAVQARLIVLPVLAYSGTY